MRDREALHRLRVNLVSAIAQLCKRRESPCLGPAKRACRSTTRSAEDDISQRPGVKRCRKLDTDDDSFVKRAEPPAAGHRGPLSTCPFCELSDVSVGPCQRQKLWRIDSLGRHIRTQHLERKDTQFDCPFRDCPETLACAVRLVDHMAGQHGLRLPPSVVLRRSPRNHGSEGVDELAFPHTHSTVPTLSANPRSPTAVSRKTQEGPRHLDAVEPSNKPLSSISSRCVTCPSPPTHIRDIITPENRVVCPFCGRDEDVKSMPRHVSDYHHRGKQVPFRCPYEGCRDIIGAAKYFSDHCYRRHPFVN